MMNNTEMEWLLQFCDANVKYNQAMDRLLTTFKNDCIFKYGDHYFNITPEWIGGIVVRPRNDSNLIILDKNDIPILVTDVNQFIMDAMKQYDEAINNYHSNLKTVSLLAPNYPGTL